MRLRDRLWNPYAVVFLSNACIMVPSCGQPDHRPRLASLYT